MISEKNFASEFNGFWSETLPLLTPSFVKVFNEVYCHNLADRYKNKFKDIPVGINVVKHDLLAEFAFCVAEILSSESISINAFRSNNSKISIAHEKALAFLKRYKIESNELLLNSDEIEESFIIAKQYQYFLSSLHANNITFRPKLKGAGFLGECTADLSVDDTLYEVKTVKRNLAGKDIKQLLIYFALHNSSGGRQWVNGGFFNPRKALYYKFPIDSLIYQISGGRSATEVFQDIIDFLSYRDIEIDSVF